MAESTSTPKIKEEETSKKEVYSPSADEQELIEKWKKRFTRAEEYLRPYRAKWLRMYKHYRAYQEKTNYAYQTRLMPPIAFQIVETVASRLATAKRKTHILPRDKKDTESKSIGAWNDLVGGDLGRLIKEEDKATTSTSSANILLGNPFVAAAGQLLLSWWWALFLIVLAGLAGWWYWRKYRPEPPEPPQPSMF